MKNKSVLENDSTIQFFFYRSKQFASGDNFIHLLSSNARITLTNNKLRTFVEIELPTFNNLNKDICFSLLKPDENAILNLKSFKWQELKLFT